MNVSTEIWTECPNCHKQSQMEITFHDDRVDFQCEWGCVEGALITISFEQFLKCFQWNQHEGRMVQTTLMP